jgi:hypothetical protein
MNIFLDIETIPCQRDDIKAEFLASVKAPATYKKPESIEAWLAENREAEAEAALLKTSFDGGLGQVVCLCWGTEALGTQSHVVADLSPAAERAMLIEWEDAINSVRKADHFKPPRFIGHNVAGFDLPFLWKRFVVLGLRPPLWLPHYPKPWGEQVFDTMTEWAGLKDRISLDRLCKVLGLKGKDGMTGADVWPAVQAGRLGEVAEYCVEDVNRVRAVYLRMTQASQLETVATSKVAA